MPRTKMTRLFGAAVVTALFAGCAPRTTGVLPAPSLDRSGAVSSVQPKAVAAAPRARKRPVTLRIVIPKPKHRGARFVSPGALGMWLKFQGPTPVSETVGLTPASNPRCVRTPSGSSCSFAFSLVTGPYTASVSLYDKAPVNGAIPAGAKLLSTLSNAPFDIARGKHNSVGLDLAGVPASFSFIDMPLATAGSAFPTPQHFTVIAKDADGFVIVGTYEHPITLQDGDTSGATSIVTLGADHPGTRQLLSSSDVATIAYTGLAIAPVTITASASGASNGTANFTPVLQPIVVTTNNTINPGFVGLDLYATSGAGSTKNFTVSEIGWTNAPFGKSIAVGGSCSSIASVTPASGTSFTAAAGGSAGTCTDTLSDGAGQQQSFVVAYSGFSATGGEQDFALPAGVNQIVAIVRGAQGSSTIGAGGRGAIVTASLPITPLDTLAIFIGNQNGYNGGGGSGTSKGGGASDIREGGTALANRIVVAGGGGGGGFASIAGGGGGFNGVAGTDTSFSSTAYPGGGGGTQSAGGSNGGDPDGCSASYTAAGLGQGGSVSGNSCPNGGGGGGGYYGGGAGASGSTGAGGGGGSSFAVVGAVASFTSDAQSGDGSVIVEF